jgi:AcrR family transcriptional regulator
LVATARALMVEQGIQVTSLQMVASTAGVSIGAIQKHFGTKNGLVLVVYSEVLADERAFQHAVLADLPSCADPVGALVTSLWAGYSHERMDFIREVERSASKDPVFTVDVQRVMSTHAIDLEAFARAIGDDSRRDFRARLNAVLTSLIGLGSVQHLIPAEVVEATLNSVIVMARGIIGPRRTEARHD